MRTYRFTGLSAGLHCALLCALLGGLLAPAPAWSMHPNHPVGFDPEKAYQSGAVDHVDLFSGSLALTIPIGPFALTYSSNVWTYEQVFDPGTLQFYTQALPDRERSAGLGWHLGWGEVYSPSHWYNPSGRWLYIGPDGGRHVFYDQLHRDEDDGDANTLYSRDGSYLRLRKISGCKILIETPNGTTRSFMSPTCGGGSTHRLTKVWSTHASDSDPDFTVTYDADFLNWTMTDRWGRTQRVELTDQYSWINRVVTRVDIESVGGQRAIYDFTYDNIQVDRSCKDDDPSTGNRIRLPHLVRIDLPDGSSYAMKDASGRFYYNHCSGGMDDNPGVLTGLIQPTLGKLEWNFQEYEFPPGDNNSVFNTSAGVQYRRMRWADGTLHGEWRYKSAGYWPAGGEDPEMHTQVVYPTGDCTKHYFNARYWLTPSQGKGWERGLPFSYENELDGKYLSSEVWTSSTAGGSCSGTKLRSTYIKYRRDQLPGSGPQSKWLDRNRIAKESRTIFHDDGDRYSEVVHSDFDGLGHFRQTVKRGTFWSGSSNNEQRTTVQQYNQGGGTYPGSFVPIDPSAPWILGLFSYVQNTELDALGETVSKTEYGFVPSTGALTCTRTLASGSSRGAHDLLTVFTRDSLGKVTDVKDYGGDLQTLTTGPGLELCGTTPAEPEYWTHDTYQYGVRKTRQPYDGQGNPVLFLTYDVDLDPSTGRVLVSRDPNGLVTTFSYDVSGRTISAVAAEGARTTFSYQNASASAPASVTIRQVMAAGGVKPGSTVLTEAQRIFDDFGRPWKQRRKIPGGVWVEQETLFNARGWTTSVSTWGNLLKRTQYLDYDPFGRAATIRPPEGSTHDVLVDYTGNRLASTRRKVAGTSGESYVSTTREMDRYGRLRKLMEPSGSGGIAGMTSTTYLYDVDRRMTRSLSGANPLQIRSFSYDNRGFRLSDTHPEKGVAGNGSVSYFDFDSHGNVHRVVDGPNQLSYQYDALGRRTITRDVNAGDRFVHSIKYDGAGGYGVGRIWKMVRHNWVELPWTAASGEEDVTVHQIRSYYGINGALSWQRTKVKFPGESAFNFDRNFDHDDLGNLDWIKYPRCIHASCSATTGPAREVTSVFDQGSLVEVEGWAPSLAYGSAGTVTAVAHSNGVTDHREPDPNRPLRVQRLYTSGASSDWNSGLYLYDGAGNISALGGDGFSYDGVSRLTGAAVGDYSQTFTYDVFGNMTSYATTHPTTGTQTVTIGIDSSTNRLTAASYDGAGNVTSWGGVVQTFGETNQIEAVGARWTYLYDTDGERVAAIDWTGSVATREMTFTVRDPGNRVLTQFSLVGADSSGNWSRKRDYIYAGRQLLASESGSGIGRHYHLDHLGSPRLLTDAAGTTLSDHLFLPYGAEVTAPGDDPIKFTGHERDFETGLDYMHARHYASSLGRFHSVDARLGIAASPQSFNRYAYVMGNPLALVDPDGRLWTRAEARQTIRLLAAGIGAASRFVPEPTTRLAVAKVGGAIFLASLAEEALWSVGIGFFNQDPYAISLTDAIAFQLREEHSKTYSIPTSPPPRKKDGSQSSSGNGECDGCMRFEGSIEVVADAPAETRVEPVPIDPNGPGVTGDTPVSGSGMVCGSGNNCVQVSISGTAEEVQVELERIEAELFALESLNDLLSGSCMVNPHACALGGYGGGGGGSAYWSVIYFY